MHVCSISARPPYRLPPEELGPNCFELSFVALIRSPVVACQICEAAERTGASRRSVTIAKTAEEAERRYMASGLVAHRKSLAYTGRDLSKQVVANLVGSPDMIREKVAGLAAIGVDHACALMIPADSISEFEEQVQWFAETVYG